MYKLKLTFFLIVSFISLLPINGYPEAQPIAELKHWWVSESELAAVAEIRGALEKQGGKFESSHLDNFNELKIDIIERLNLGYLPSITHWLAGKELQQLQEQTILLPLPDIVGGKKIRDILFDEVLTEITSNEQIAALPVGIHMQNTVYYNAKIYDSLKLSPPETWKQLFEQAEIIKNAGHTPLVVGSDSGWQLSFLLDALLLSYGGNEVFQEIFIENKPITQWRTTLTNVFSDFIKLKQYTNSNHSDQKWNINVRTLAEGHGAIQFIGDFAKGELAAMGLVAGKDFYCGLSPENNNTSYYGVDVFVMLKTENPQFQAGQKLMVETILDPEVQNAYITKKGGITVRSDIQPKDLDECAAKMYEKWTDDSHTRLPILAGSSWAKMAIFQGIQQQLWNQDQPDIKAGVDKIITAINNLNE